MASNTENVTSEVEKTTVTKVTKETTYTKEKILKSKLFMDDADVLNVVLDDNQEYTLTQVRQLKADFLSTPIVEVLN